MENMAKVVSWENLSLAVTPSVQEQGSLVLAKPVRQAFKVARSDAKGLLIALAGSLTEGFKAGEVPFFTTDIHRINNHKANANLLAAAAHGKGAEIYVRVEHVVTHLAVLGSNDSDARLTVENAVYQNAIDSSALKLQQITPRRASGVSRYKGANAQGSLAWRFNEKVQELCAKQNIILRNPSGDGVRYLRIDFGDSQGDTFAGTYKGRSRGDFAQNVINYFPLERIIPVLQRHAATFECGPTVRSQAMFIRVNEYQVSYLKKALEVELSGLVSWGVSIQEVKQRDQVPTNVNKQSQRGVPPVLEARAA